MTNQETPKGLRIALGGRWQTVVRLAQCDPGIDGKLVQQIR